MKRTVTLSALVLVVSGAADAIGSTFSWTPTDLPNIVYDDFSLTQKVDGVTVTAQGFVAEISGNDATVFGPFPTVAPQSVSSRQAGFGIALVSKNDQLGLIAHSFPGVDLGGSDWQSGVAPGFNSWYWSPNDAPQKFDFAVFKFDKPVDIGSVTVDDASNNDRNVWMATGISAPDFNNGFLAALTAFDVVNSADDAGDGKFTHALGAEKVTYLLVGAPPRYGLGPLNAGYSQFYIDSINAAAVAETPTVPSAVPLPATLPLLLTGLAGVGFLGRLHSRKAA